MLYWVVGAEADSAFSQIPGVACKADAIGIDLTPYSILLFVQIFPILLSLTLPIILNKIPKFLFAELNNNCSS